MFRRFVLAVTSLLVASAAAAVAHTTGPPGGDSDRSHRWLYVSGGANESAVVAYDLSAPGMPLVETITQGIDYPDGIAISRDGTLYVANAGGSAPGVYAYPWGQTSPSAFYPIASPGVPLVARNGDLYVTTRDTPPSILIYRRGHRRPSHVVTSSLLQVPAQIIFDGAGDLLVTDNNTGVLVMQRGSLTLQSLGLQDLDGCTGGIALDEATKALFVTDCLGGTQEYILGNPYPVENLVEPFPSDNLAIGRVDDHHLTLFAPNLFTGQVVFYDVKTTTPYETLQTDLVEALGVLYKPAGIPL
jgi:DNA-binding beta-propeller fold protein YncE